MSADEALSRLITAELTGTALEYTVGGTGYMQELRLLAKGGYNKVYSVERSATTVFLAVCCRKKNNPQTKKREKKSKMRSIGVSMVLVSVAITSVAVYHAWRAGAAPSVYITDPGAADTTWRKLWLGDQRRVGAPVTRHDVGELDVRPPSSGSSAVVVDGVLVFSRDADSAWVWVRRRPEP
jgi:hypothetical protein